MKILHIIWDSSIGGLETSVYHLSVAQKKSGENIDVVVLSKIGPIYYKLEAAGIPVHFFSMQNPNDFKGLAALYRLIDSQDYNIIHLHERRFLVNLILKLKSKIPIIFSEHGGELIGGNRINQLKRRIFYECFSSSFSEVVANSNYVKEVLMKNVPGMRGKISTIYNSINIDELPNKAFIKEKVRTRLGINPINKVFGILARLVYLKGVDIFVEAANEICKHEEKVTFLIIGDGPERRRLEVLASQLNSSIDIRFVGMQENIWEFLPALDIYLFTSRWESFGMSLIEAMSIGIPIVGFNLPGANEIVEHNKTGLLVAPYNINALTANSLDLLSNTIRYSKFSEDCKNSVKTRFSLQNSVVQFLKVYKKAIYLKAR